MEDLLLDFIKKHQMLVSGQTTILAVSGGVDSVVLSHLFHSSGLKFEIAHCNFLLRGESSDLDEKLVRDLANNLSVPFHTKSFDTEAYANRNQLSIQMAARDLRYAWFAELIGSDANKKIGTAHHQGDIVETTIFNLTKGTGIAGMHGIPLQRDILIRPLLFATKADINKYAQSQSLVWREDESNSSVKYARNLIRQQVVPVLKKINPSLEQSFFKSANRIQQTEDYLSYAISELRSALVSKRGSDIFISFNKLRNIPGAVTVLFELIKEYGFTYDQAVDIMNPNKSSTGALFFSKNKVLNIDRKHIIISAREQQEIHLEVQEGDHVVISEEVKLAFEILPARNIEMDGSSEIAYLDINKLKFPLILRSWKEGDCFYPLGLGGKKKLSDFMIDSKIALNLKRSVLVLVSGNDIAWVVGHRLDDRYKVKAATKEVMKVVLMRVEDA